MLIAAEQAVCRKDMPSQAVTVRVAAEQAVCRQN